MDLSKAKNIEKGDWFKLAVCVSCYNTLTDKQVSYSDGICPKCGHDSFSTFCDTYTIVVRVLTYHFHPWWMFWEHPISKIEIQNPESEKAQRWINAKKSNI